MNVVCHRLGAKWNVFSLLEASERVKRMPAKCGPVLNSEVRVYARVQVVVNPPRGAICSAPGVFPNYLARQAWLLSPSPPFRTLVRQVVGFSQQYVSLHNEQESL